jgi:hypothetical protein
LNAEWCLNNISIASFNGSKEEARKEEQEERAKRLEWKL